MAVKKATFDPARRLDIYFRIARDASKSFTFVNADGSARAFVYDEFQLIIKKYPGAAKNVLLLDLGAGISYASNVLIATVTTAQSTIDEGEYYWELYNDATNKTWLSGYAYFHNGVFDGVENESETITVTEDGDDIVVTISESGGGGLDSVGNLSPLFTSNLTGADLTFAQVAQNANLIYAGPATGAAANPTFRALVLDDIPSITNAKINDVAWGKITGTPTTLAGYGITDAAPISGSANYWKTSGATTITTDLEIDGTSLTGISFGVNTPLQFFDIVGTTVYLGAEATGTNYNLTLGTTSLSFGKPSVATFTINDANGPVFLDGRGTKRGIEYNASGYVTQPRSLTDKEYVDNAFWKISGTSTLTSDVTIAQAGFNNLFLNGNSLFGPTGATITGSTRADFRGIASGNVTRWGSDANTTLGAFQNDGIFYVSANPISGSTYKIQTSGNVNTTYGAFHAENLSTGAAAFTRIQLSNSAQNGQIILNGSGNSNLAGANSLNFATSSTTSNIGFAPNSAVRYQMSTFTHTWTQQAGSAGGQTFLSYTQSAQTGGIQTGLLYTGGAHTTVTASEHHDWNINLARTVQFTGSTGFALQRSVLIQGVTYAFASPTGTITDVDTVFIQSPLVGTNAAFTRKHALGLGGALQIAIDTVAMSSVLANTISISARDSSDGSANATLALYLEQAPEATATFTQSHRLKVWINGTEYYLPLDNV